MGDHLKKPRLDLAMSQKHVALRLQVNDRTIRNRENNKTTPAVRYLPRVMGFLGYDPLAAGALLGAMAPERRGEIVALGIKSIVAGTIATSMTGAVAGLLI